MCGIVGWISQENAADAYDRKRFMEQALIIDTIRGGDSTGLFVVPKMPLPDGLKPYWIKDLGGGHRLVCTKEYQDIYAAGFAANYKFSVGHNRSATIGGVTLEAAHPFQEGPITLVHNGTLTETHSLGKSMRELDAANDSHAICHNLALSSVEEVISKLNGAFALVWHDSRDDSLNMIRNSLRPLHMAKAKTANTIYFASEGEMLHLLSTRLALNLDCIVSLKPGFWLKFKGTELMVPEVKELPLFTHPVHRSTTVGANWGRRPIVGTTTNSPTRDGYPNLNSEYYSRLRGEEQEAKRTRAKKKGDLIPDNCQLDLCDLDMDPDMEFNFVPIDAILCNWRKSNPSYTVFGRILLDANRIVWAMVHGVAPHAWEKAANRLWTVTPLGVYHQGWEDNGIVARLKTSIAKGNKMEDVMDVDLMLPWPKGDVQPLTHRLDDVPEGSKSLIVYEGEEEPDMEDAAWERVFSPNSSVVYPGPGARSFTYKEWVEYTESGCIGCSRPLAIHEAWSIAWVNEGDRDPLCYACQVEEGRVKPVA